MKLSKRLEKIASFIEDNSKVVDIGCDHALLDIFLVKKYPNISCFACDINKNALKMACKNIIKYKLEDKIITKCCDGIDDVEIDNNTIIVISGMGRSTIMHILENKKSENAKEIIIQSNNEIPLLRNDMIKKGYFINNEIAIRDRKKYYVIINFKKGNKKYNKDEIYLGPILMKNKDENLNYFKYLKDKEEYIFQNIPDKYIDSKKESEKRIKKIMQLLK